MNQPGNENRRVIITYGTFDLFHFGHLALLQNAKQLGTYLIVGITSDAFDKQRGKLNVKQPLIERIHAVEETGLADKIIVEEFKGQKIEDIRKYGVDVFTVGSDWIGRFDYLKEYCEVVYLPRTKGISSTQLRKSSAPLSLACIGVSDYSQRIIRESRYVSGMEVKAICDTGAKGSLSSAAMDGLHTASSFEDLAYIADAVYISASPSIRTILAKQALGKGLHVLCEGPIARSAAAAQGLYSLAEQKGLVLMEAHTVLYEPGFQRLKLLLESGAVGEIKDIDASYSQAPSTLDYSDPMDGGIYTMGSRSVLPALALIGAKPNQASITAGYKGDFCNWAKFDLLYPTATATLKMGRGVKTEGDMTITGTDGYIYIPAPWWKLEYFEVRGEDLRDTKKHYYECAGEGQRYLLKEFLGYCRNANHYALASNELMQIELAITDFIERIESGDCNVLEDRSARFGGGETLGEIPA